MFKIISVGFRVKERHLHFYSTLQWMMLQGPLLFSARFFYIFVLSRPTGGPRALAPTFLVASASPSTASISPLP